MGQEMYYVVGPIVLGLLVVCVLFWICWRKSNDVEFDKDRLPVTQNNVVGSTRVVRVVHDEALALMNRSMCFPYDVLCKATDSFSNRAKIGEGKFGDVYKAVLQNPNRVVAVKKLKPWVHEQSKKEFIQEIASNEPLIHRNLVQLIGYSNESQGRVLLLIFEFIPNGTLDKHLFGDSLSGPLSWPHRYKIALGLASGVEYLHNGGKKCLIHRDIKPENVMLDGDFVPKLGDFGLARLTDHGNSMITTAQAGTFGYMAPEIAFSGEKASKESDVFSFGIVALEIATGRGPSVPQGEGAKPLVTWVWSLNKKGRILDAVDERLGYKFNRDEAKRLLVVGLICCHNRASKRPKMERVIALLNGERLISCEQVEPLEGYFNDVLSRSSASTTQGTSLQRSSNSSNSNKSSKSDSTQYYTPGIYLRPTSRQPRKVTPGTGLPNIKE